MPKIRALQVFRGLAALLVLLYHASLVTREYFGRAYDGGLFAFGYAGVDSFFVLSGFIIMYVHQHDFGRRGAIGPYLRKRFIRIYPTYWIVTLAILPVYFLRSDFGRGTETAPWTILTSFLLIPQQEKPILGVAWTLSHEIKFYVLFALCLFLGWSAAKHVFFIFTVGSAFLFVSGGLSPSSDLLGFTFRFLFDPYNLAFAMGCLGAWIAVNAAPRDPIFVVAIGVIGFAVSATLDHLASPPIAGNSIATFGLTSACIVLGAASKEIRDAAGRGVKGSGGSRRGPTSLVRAALMFAGNASYSMYLTHTIFLSALVKYCAHLGLVETIGLFLTGSVIVTGAIVGGCGFHLLVERPLLSFVRNRVPG